MLTADKGMTTEPIMGKMWRLPGSLHCGSPKISSAVILLSAVNIPISLLMAVVFLAMAGMQVEAQGTSKSKDPPSTVIEGRVDAIFSKKPTAQAGVGISMFGGTYVRTGIVAAIGANEEGVTGRTDGFVRFHLDPFRQSRWAPYGGAGLSGRYDAGSRPKAYLLVFAGFDGPVRNGLTTSFEAGLGGGARIGVVVRQTVAERR
jgi:hypothetical protein